MRKFRHSSELRSQIKRLCSHVAIVSLGLGLGLGLGLALLLTFSYSVYRRVLWIIQQKCLNKEIGSAVLGTQLFARTTQSKTLPMRDQRFRTHL